MRDASAHGPAPMTAMVWTWTHYNCLLFQLSQYRVEVGAGDANIFERDACALTASIKRDGGADAPEGGVDVVDVVDETDEFSGSCHS